MSLRNLSMSLTLTGLFFFSALSIGQPGHAQSVEDDLAALKAGQAELAKQIAEIKRLLEAKAAPSRPAGPNVVGKTFDLGQNPTHGSEQARVALIEFTDYQCPYCSRHVNNTHPQIKSQYIDTGKIRYVSLDMPIPSLHPLAFKAAEASHCAEDQGKFWEMHDQLFANQRTLEPWNKHAEALGLDVAIYEDCLESGKHRDAIRQDMAEATKAGASGTPSFVVGLVDENDPKKVQGLSFIRGAQPFSAFQTALDQAIAKSAGSPEKDSGR